MCCNPMVWRVLSYVASIGARSLLIDRAGVDKNQKSRV